eukprot:905433_1
MGDLTVVRQILTIDSNANVIAHGMDVMRLLRCYYADEPMSPCYLGCYAGCNVVAKVLLETLKQGINEQTYGTNTLQMAAQAGYNKIVQILYEAISERQPKVVKCLMDHNTEGDLCFYGQTKFYSPLMEACHRGFDEIVELLVQSSNININHHKETNYDNATALYLACRGGATQCVRHLLSNHSVIINEATPTGGSPLLIASSQGHDEIVEMLIDHSNRMSVQGIKHGTLDVNQCDIEGLTPLLAAAREGHTKIVTILLRNEADVNACGKEGVTSLMVSSQQGHVDVVRVLLSHPSIDIDHQDVQGTTALMAACFTNQLEVVEVLLNPRNQLFETDNEKKQTKSRKGANPNLTMHAPCEGVSALHFAAAEGNAEIVKMIYEHLLTVKTITSEDIVDFVNAAGTEGYTPLHCGSREGSEDVVKYLVNVVKVDIFKKDDDNMNALDIASSLGHNAIVTWLSNLYSDDVDHSLEHESNKANK